MAAFEAVRLLYPDSSRRTLKNWLSLGRFTVDGAVVKREDALLKKDQILRAQEKFQPPKNAFQLKVLYEDRFLIAVEKPAGLLSVPLEEASRKPHALALLRQSYGTDQIFAVHRIDRETSGLLVFARGKESARRFNDLFAEHDIEREYFALVEGALQTPSGTWESHLKELASFDVVEAFDGKLAVTHFCIHPRPLQKRVRGKYTALQLRLETGRKHQIRVHSANAGHPVLGDKRYGSVENPLKRLCLHAVSLSFVHPFTKASISIRSPLPEEFHRFLEKEPALKFEGSEKSKISNQAEKGKPRFSSSLAAACPRRGGEEKWPHADSKESSCP